MKVIRVFESPPKEFASASIDESAPDYVFGSLGTVQNEMQIYDAPVSEMKTAKLNWKVLCKRADMLVRGIETHGDYVFAITHTGAPHYKVVRASLASPDWEHAETIIPEASDAIISMTKCKDYLLIVYSNGVVDRLVKYDLATGKTSDVPLPGSGAVTVSCPDWKSDRCLVTVTGWIAPVTTLRFRRATGFVCQEHFSTQPSHIRALTR